MVKTPPFYQMVFFLLILFIVFDSTFSSAAIYSWEDENGITNFTNDKNAIPKQFRDQSKFILKSKQKTKDFDNQKVVIPLRRSGSILTVSAKINGFLPALFVVDTGATYTTISRETAAKLKINIASSLPTLSLQTANGTTEAPLIKLKAVNIGSVVLNDVMAVILDIGSGFTGLLGLSFLNEFNYSVNPVDNKLILKPLEDPRQEKLIGGHGQKWWQREFSMARGRIQREKMNLENLKILRDRTTDEKSLSLTEKRISKSRINLDYFKNEFKILNNKATLLIAPIMWRQ